MPIFIAQGRFSHSAIKGMVDNPENREPAVAALMESLGAKLIAWYLTTGEYDWMVIVDGPDQQTVISAAMVAASGGGVAETKTISAYTGAEAMEMFKRARGAAGSFKSAGRAG